MQLLEPEELVQYLQESDLFQEFFELPDAERYHEALSGARAWSLLQWDRLPNPHERKGAYVVISGELGEERHRDLSEEVVPPRIFGQWTGLRGEPLEYNLVAVENSIVLECLPELLQLLLQGDLATQFKWEFFQQFVSGLRPIADTPEETLEKVVRASRFWLKRPGETVVKAGEYSFTMFFVLEGAAVVQLPTRLVSLSRGDFFGEMAVLTYQQRAASVLAEGDCLLIECDRDAVGDLRKKSKRFKEIIETVYRERVMLSKLQETRLFRGWDPLQLELVCASATLESYEPYEPVFFQGDAADALYIVVSGTMTVVEETTYGPLPLSAARAGDTLGEMALLPEISGSETRRQTITALQRADAIRLPAEVVRDLLFKFPSVREELVATATQRLRENRAAAMDSDRVIPLAWMLDTQHIAGKHVLAVDMDECIRCNNCVVACQSVHADGISRFSWQTMRQDEDLMPSVRFSTSCQHCEFALCMRVCPTNAIEREVATGGVFIDYDKCIKCGKCGDPSVGCPYGSIQIVPTDEVRYGESFSLLQMLGKWLKPAPKPADEPAQRTGTRYPAKCDLCHGMSYQACVHHCPTGAVFRVDGVKQFTHALEEPPDAGPDRNRPQADLTELKVNVGFTRQPMAGKPAELKIRFAPAGDGSTVMCRMPERGVSSIKLNMFLSAPDSVRIGGGGPLRQVLVPVDDLEAEVEYVMTSRNPGPLDLTLSTYQGGLYMGRLPINTEILKPEK